MREALGGRSPRGLPIKVSAYPTKRVQPPRTLRGHKVLVAFPCKNGEKVKDVEEEILVGMR